MIERFKTDGTACVYCGSKPELYHYVEDDLFYIRCSGCNKYGAYQFIGINRKDALESWELANRPLNRNAMKVKSK